MKGAILMEQRYRVLRIVATLIKVLAWIVLVLGLLGAILLVIGAVAGGLGGLGARAYRDLAMNTTIGAVVGSIIMGLGSVLYFLFIYAAGELIHLLLDIEQNTRETAYYLKTR